MFKHLIVPGDVATFALNLLLFEENFHVAPNRSRDEWVGTATGTLHFSFSQVLGTSDAENLVTGCDDAALRVKDEPRANDTFEALSIMIFSLGKLRLVDEVVLFLRCEAKPFSTLF